MFPPLSEIAVLRRRLGLTQHQLARSAGVSQSLIAKLESGRLDPSFSKAVAIFDALEQAGRRESGKTAAQVMRRKVIFSSPNESLRETARKMRSHGISQMPVLHGGHVSGVVTEADVLNALIAGRKAARVEEVMEPAPPSVSPQTGVQAVSSLLRHCSLVLVADKGKTVGVIARPDLFNSLE